MLRRAHAYFRDTGMRHDPALVQEGEELARIFAASVATARKNSRTSPLRLRIILDPSRRDTKRAHLPVQIAAFDTEHVGRA